MHVHVRKGKKCRQVKELKDVWTPSQTPLLVNTQEQVFQLLL